MSSTSSSSSLLIYEALKLIRGTRAMQMAIGSRARAAAVLRLAALSAADRRLADPQRAGVRRVRGDRAVSVGHPARAVASGPRAVLPVLRRAPSARPRRSRKSSPPPACSRKRKVGAIIVFEREIGLRNYVESGIPIDAAVSYDLLTTIFQPSTPLHDGAVIISEDRDRRGGVLSAADGQSQARSRSRHAPSRGHRPDRGIRRASRSSSPKSAARSRSSLRGRIERRLDAGRSARAAAGADPASAAGRRRAACRRRRRTR